MACLVSIRLAGCHFATFECVENHASRWRDVEFSKAGSVAFKGARPARRSPVQLSEHQKRVMELASDVL